MSKENLSALFFVASKLILLPVLELLSSIIVEAGAM
jgi:hypothetical protein